jgi:hypothetical protein
MRESEFPYTLKKLCRDLSPLSKVGMMEKREEVLLFFYRTANPEVGQP